MTRLRGATNMTRPTDDPIASDKPSIAVLPFDNLSEDPRQEYFADGMVEDITTALSRIRWLFVIARPHIRLRRTRQAGHIPAA